MAAPIPIVDFGKFLYGSDEERKRIAGDIDDAFRNVGFVYLENHGVPKDKVDECFEWSKAFFALPLSTKLLAPHPPGSTHHRGYSSPGLEKVSQHTYDSSSLAALRCVPDYKESFESGNTADAFQPNIWLPEDALPGFRGAMESFFTLCEGVVKSVLDALSLALDVSPLNGLADTHAQSLFQLRILHYPPLPAADLASQKRARINAHSDFGSVTLLFQDGVGGLEIEDPREKGVWRGIQPRAGCVLVNVGDLMARWSNERWKSTVHRVVAPQGGQDGDGDDDKVLPPRYSIPFFAAPDPDTLIDALPGCWSASNPKKYDPVTVGEYVKMRMAALYEDE